VKAAQLRADEAHSEIESIRESCQQVCATSDERCESSQFCVVAVHCSKPGLCVVDKVSLSQAQLQSGVCQQVCDDNNSCSCVTITGM